MDRERRVVRQLVDTECEIVVQCSEEVHISDNCNNWMCNRASCAPFRAVAETIEPKMQS